MMKKEERVERRYMRVTTAAAVAIVCLVAGFVGGLVYSRLTAGSPTSVRSYTVEESTSAERSTQAQSSAQLLKLRQAVADNPQDAEAWVLLGNFYFDIDEYESAIQAYQKHLKLRPDNADVWTDLGIMYRRRGQPGEAIRAFDKAAEVAPQHLQSRFNKGIVLMYDLKDRPAALKAWEELLKIAPSFQTPQGRPLADLVRQLHTPHNQ
jgi:cytochrome c-type biogenesis protein CcmH/NrfG